MKKLEHKYKVKPLSANKMFGVKGRRTYKTPEYVAYQNEIRDLLTWDLENNFEWPFGKDPVRFNVVAGLSNRGADIDNVLKPLLDTYQNMFEDFNDNKVYQIDVEKMIVPKGEEYLEVLVEEYNEDNN